ncbi:MAG: c-type cytochrome biogenesis protein CcmI [Thalassotalea sp.]
MTVIITLVVFILLILVIVWWHFLAPQKVTEVDQGMRDKTNKDLYLEHKDEIEQDFQQGKIDEENYHFLLAELDKGLLQDMEENQQHSAAVKPQQPASFLWPVAITIFVLIFSFALYQKNGAFALLQQPKNQHANLDESQQAGIARLEQLKAQITAEPKNANLWYALGQELVALGDFDNAITAFDKTIEIDGLAADLVGAKAQAAYYKDGQKITPAVQQLIDQALSLDPTDAPTNILLGMHAFSLGKYQAAIDYWQGLVDAQKSINLEALAQAINEAKSRLGQATTTEITQAQTNISDNVESTVGVNLSVTIAPDILEQLSGMADKIVFIYAVPANGTRMPVAAVKLSASDLPTSIVLDDARAMNPQMKISNFDKVNVFAVISMQGTPGIKAGDFKGQQDNIVVQDNVTVNLVIDTVAK